MRPKRKYKKPNYKTSTITRQLKSLNLNTEDVLVAKVDPTCDMACRNSLLKVLQGAVDNHVIVVNNDVELEKISTPIIKESK